MSSPDKLGVGAPIIEGPLTEQQTITAEKFGITLENGLGVHYQMAGYYAVTNAGVEEAVAPEDDAPEVATVTPINSRKKSSRAGGHIRQSIRRGTRRNERDRLEDVLDLARQGMYEEIEDLYA